MCRRFTIATWLSLAIIAMPVAARAAGPIVRARTVTFKGTVFEYTHVNGSVFSPDLSLTAFYERGEICIFDLNTGKPVQRFAPEHTLRYELLSIWSLAVSADRQRVYTIDENRQLVGWQIQPGSSLGEIQLGYKRVPGVEATPRLSLDPKGRYRDNRAATGFGPNLRFCALGGSVFTVDPPAPVLETDGSGISFSADGLHCLAYGGKLDRTIELYSFVDGKFKHVRSFLNEVDWFKPSGYGAMAYDPAHGWIAQGMGTGVGVWVLETGEVMGTVQFQMPDRIEFSPDGGLLRVNAESYGLSHGSVFSTGSFEEVHSMKNQAGFSSDGRKFVSYTRDGGYVFFDIQNAPPYLELEVVFDDQASGGNGKLDSGETAAVVLSVRNTGRGSAFGVKAVSVVDFPTVAVADTVPLGAIPAGMMREIRIPLTAAPEANSGIGRMKIETIEVHGFDAQPTAFDLAFNRVEPPLLSLGTNPTVDDAPSAIAETAEQVTADQMAALLRLEGNGDRILGNGETAKVSVPIVNGGQGAAYGVTATTVNLNRHLKLESPLAEVGDIAPGDTAYAEFVLHVDKTYPDKTMELSLEIRDIRATVATLEAIATVPYAKLEPVLEFTYRVHDGGTEASRGNGNGVVEQGELVELVLTLENSGMAAARNLTSTLAIQRDGVALDRGTARLDELLPGAESEEMSLTFMLQRSVEPGPLPLTLLFSMADYPPVLNRVNLTVYESGVALVDLRQSRPEAGDAIWLAVSLDEAGTVWDLATDPLDPKTIFLATELRGVLFSEDRGLTWRELNEGLPERAIRCLAVNSSTPRLLLAGSASSGVFRLEGDGPAWMPSGKGIGKHNNLYPACRNLTFAPAGTKVAYLGTSDGLYVSENQGEKWSKSKKLPGTNVMDLSLLTGLEEALLVTLGEGLVCRSLDQGKNWESILAEGLVKGVIGTAFKLAADPANADRIFLAAGLEGILRTLDGGKSWTGLRPALPGSGEGLEISIGSILINPVNPTIIYAGSGSGRVFESRDDGESWQATGFGAVGKQGEGPALLHADGRGTLFAGGESGLYQLGSVKSNEALGSVLFGSSSSSLSPHIAKALVGIVELLIQDDALKVTIEGHTDNIGSEAANRELALARAQEVRAYLLESGVAANRIVARGFGWEHPVGSNETPEGRSHNRRVEVIVAGPAAD